MRILITGATGLIGQEIVALCHGKKIMVNYLTTSKDKIVSKESYQGFYWNPDIFEIDLECFSGVSAIINLAGASISKRWTDSYKKEILDSRLNSLKTLYRGLERVKSNKITSFVSASAIGIYPHSLSSYYTEDEKWVDDSFLGEVVEQWELETDRFDNLDLFVTKENPNLGYTHLVEHKIHLKPNAVGKHHKPYRLPPYKREVLREQLDNLLEQGLVEPVREQKELPITSPIVLVTKQNEASNSKTSTQS